MSLQATHPSRAFNQLSVIPLFPRITGTVAAIGGKFYDSLSSSLRAPLFNALQYILAASLVVVPLVGALASVKITYIALAVLALFVLLPFVALTLQRGSTNELNRNFMTWITEGRLSDVVFAITAGADVNCQDESGQTPLVRATISNQVEIVRLLATSGAEVDLRNGSGFGWRALMHAAFMGHTETVQALIDLGADVHLKNREGGTALMVAAEEGHTETVQALAARGAHVDVENTLGLTALMLAIRTNHPDTLQALIDLGADIHLQSSRGNNPLMTAAQYGATSLVRTILQASRTPINAQDDQGKTALMKAALTGRTEMVQMLIGSGADVHIRDNYGHTALTLAINAHREETAQVLRAGNGHRSIGRATNPSSIS